MLEIRWHGRGGQGSFTVARLLGMAASVYGGKYAQAFPSFGPERRGAPVLGFTRIDDKKITDRSEVLECDYVIVLDETLWGPSVLKGLKDNTVIIINTKAKEKYINEVKNKIVCFDATTIAIEYLNRPITNTAMLAVLMGVSDIISLDECKNALKESMKTKIADKNILLVDKVYHMVKEEIHG